MAFAAEAVTTALVVALVMVTALAMLIGILGSAFGEGFERCPRCDRWTLSVHGQAHEGGCPVTVHEHVCAVLRAAFGGIHLRHH
jgi:hypothetical protein